MLAAEQFTDFPLWWQAVLILSMVPGIATCLLVVGILVSACFIESSPKPWSDAELSKLPPPGESAAAKDVAAVTWTDAS